MTARNPKYLCSLGLKTLGEKTVSCDLSHPSMNVKETSLGFVIDDHALGAYGLIFNKDGLQTDSDGNVLGDPCYWLEF